MKKTSVFISHSATQNIEPLLNLLKAENIKSHDSFDLTAGQNIAESILSAIDRSDAVIAVLSRDVGFANVTFEMGYATALRKPILLLVSPGTIVPGFAFDTRYLVSEITDSDILRLGIKKFLAESPKRASSRRKDKSLQSIPADRQSIRTLVDRLTNLRHTIDGRTAEEIVAGLLGAAGLTVIEEQSGLRDKGVDFAVWSDSLQSTLGNPILIEVKADPLNDRQFNDAYDRLVRQVGETDARFGLLLYVDRAGDRFKRPALWVPFVLAFDLEDFAKELLTKPFANAVMERRNKLVHGLPE